MATQTSEEGRYEVKIWVGDYDPETGEGYLRSYIYQGRTFTSFDEADNIARQRKDAGNIVCAVILEDGLKIHCHGTDVDTESPCGIVTGWMIWTGPRRPRHIDRGQWDPPEECSDRYYAETPEQWERIERQTRGKNRQCYILVEPTIGLKNTEEVGGRPGQRYKWTPDFFPLGMKLVRRYCDYCEKLFWAPYDRFRRVSVCEQCYRS